MSVFPAASGKFLPPTWREKMSAPVSNAPLLSFSMERALLYHASGIKENLIFLSQRRRKILVLKFFRLRLSPNFIFR